MTDFVRVVSYYDKITEWQVAEIDLPYLPLSELQRALSEPPENTLYGCHIIDQKSARYFEFVLGVKFDFDKYDYFLESRAI